MLFLLYGAEGLGFDKKPNFRNETKTFLTCLKSRLKFTPFTIDCLENVTKISENVFFMIFDEQFVK